MFEIIDFPNHCFPWVVLLVTFIFRHDRNVNHGVRDMKMQDSLQLMNLISHPLV